MLDPSGNDTLALTTSGVDGEFATIKAANFAANRRGYSIDCVLHDKYSIGGIYQNSSGFAELPGDDLVVSMGQWAIGDHNFIGNTFMHPARAQPEPRGHGGNEDRNFKPNYNSIMNYWYQMCGTDLDFNVIPDNALDFSRGLDIALNESALNEPAGVTGFGPAIDWNLNGNFTNINVTRNINCRLTNTFADSVCGNHMQLSVSCGTLACFDLLVQRPHRFQ